MQFFVQRLHDMEHTHTQINGWNPHDLLHCLDSTSLGYATALLSLGVVFWYILITYRWWQAASQSSGRSRAVWFSLVLVFLLCLTAGYLTVAIAVFHPKAAAVVRVVALAVQNTACPIFLYWASAKKFRAISSRDQIGHEIIQGVDQNLDDKQLASLARQLVIKSLERRTHG